MRRLVQKAVRKKWNITRTTPEDLEKYILRIQTCLESKYWNCRGSKKFKDRKRYVSDAIERLEKNLTVAED